MTETDTEAARRRHQESVAKNPIGPRAIAASVEATKGDPIPGHNPDDPKGSRK